MISVAFGILEAKSSSVGSVTPANLPFGKLLVSSGA